MRKVFLDFYEDEGPEATIYHNADNPDKDVDKNCALLAETFIVPEGFGMQSVIKYLAKRGLTAVIM
jgi:hypothetical protein